MKGTAYRVHSATQKLRLAAGKVSLSAAGAVLSFDRTFSAVAKTGTGVYRATLRQPYYETFFAGGSIRSLDPTPLPRNVVTVNIADVQDSKTTGDSSTPAFIDFMTLTAAGAAADATGTCEVHLDFAFSDHGHVGASLGI